MNTTALLARITLAGILSVAACAKLINPESFQTSLESFKLFPNQIIPFLASFVPILEIFTAMLLILKNKAPQGAILSSILSVGFVASLTWGIITKNIEECGCFGDWEMAKVSPQIALLRAFIILTLSVLLSIRLTSTAYSNAYSKKELSNA